MPADAPADAGEPLRRTTADAKNPQKMAADAFPAFEKYKVKAQLADPAVS